MFDKANLEEFFKKAQEVQNQISEQEALLEKTFVTGTAGGGVVKIEMNCVIPPTKVRVKMADNVFEEIEHDKELLENLIEAATSDALRRLKEKAEENYKKLMPFGNMFNPGI